MTRCLALVALLAACGGKAPAPSPAPLSAEEQAFVDQADGWRRTVCACRDSTCADEAWHQQGFAWPPDGVTLGDTAAALLGHAYVDFNACYATARSVPPRAADPAALVERATSTAAATCACETPACVDPHRGVWLDIELTQVDSISDAGAAQLYRAMVDARRCERRIDLAAEGPGLARAD